MSTTLPFSNTTISLYPFEGFSYVIYKPVGSSSIAVSSQLPSSYFTTDSCSVTFASSGSSNKLSAGSTQSFTLTSFDASASPLSNVTDTVVVNAGRFLDPSGNPTTGNAYTFYSQEPITPIRLVAPFTVSSVVSSPTLPPGLSFQVAGSNVTISGTPLTTVPTSNYQFIGTNSVGNVITTINKISVSNERILYNLSGTPIVSNMVVGTPIATRKLTAAFPPYPSGGTLRYTWYPAFPDGIRVYDTYGNDVTSSNLTGFSTTDASHAFTISGTPTLTAAYAFSNAGSASNTYTIVGQRTSPGPTISNTFAMTFSFAETVLFDPTSIPTLYTGVPVNSSTNFFHATTQFATGPYPGISNMYSPNLRSDLSLTFVPGLGRANLTGTPTYAGSASYTIRAINSNGVQRDYITPITVQSDSVTFSSSSPAQDTCWNFVLSRPSEQALTGYYPSGIKFSATAASGLPVTLTAAALTGTGLTFVGGTIGGTPLVVTPLTTLDVVATVSGSPATATRSVKFAILDDVFTIADISSSFFKYVQNIPIKPFTVSTTTLSGRPILTYAQSGLPSGVSISPAGVVSGTPRTLGSSVTFSPTTGYASGSRTFSYTIVPDNVLLTTAQSNYDLTPGAAVSIPVTGVAYSGTTVNNYRFTGLVPTYGLTIGSTSGNIGGTLSSGVPPDPLLPSQVDFAVTASAGVLDGSLSAILRTKNPIIARTFLVKIDSTATNTGTLYATDNNSGYSSWSSTFGDTSGIAMGARSIVVKDTSLQSNVFMIPLMNNDANSNFYRSTDGINFSSVTIDPSSDSAPIVSSVVHKPGSTTWWAGGAKKSGATQGNALLLTSDDDGLTWTSIDLTVQLGFKTRTSDNSSTSNSYTAQGTSIAYSNNVLLLGGQSNGYPHYGAIARRFDDGTRVSWSEPSYTTGNPFLECGNFSVDVSGMWIATGSDQYRSGNAYGSYSRDAQAIKYSTDSGQTWSDVTWTNTSNFINYIGYDIQHGPNGWIATGVKYVGSPTFKYFPTIQTSSNGSNWSPVDLSTNDLFPSVSGVGSLPLKPPIQIGPILYDGSNWNVVVTRPVSTSPPLSNVTEIYTHDASSSLTSGWSVLANISPFGTAAGAAYPFLGFSKPQDISTGSPIQSSLTFTVPTGGPVVTSPIQTNYIVYQYIPIDSITLHATGTGQIYYYVQNTDLPDGLSFDPITATISGTPARAGADSVTFYIRDDIAVTRFVLNFTVLIPRIIRKQDGAGAYTSLLRQYTDVLAAQNARDNRVLPNQDRMLGEFMSPDAPDVVTQTIDPKCRNPAC